MKVSVRGLFAAVERVRMVLFVVSLKIYEENFTQLSKIGKGGFASVFRAVHRIDDKEYAVK